MSGFRWSTHHPQVELDELLTADEIRQAFDILSGENLNRDALLASVAPELDRGAFESRYGE